MLKVVFVDDEVDLCELFEAHFGSDEVEVITFSDPFKAVEFLKDQAIHLAFIDFRIPGMNGDQVAAAVPDGTPKYILTGELDEDRVPGGFKILNKPFDPQQIHGIIQDVKNTRP